ncbi:hypothetical protein C8R44DRAFT_874280 [Mycena epipterygia]|nr:hypothetical protein C8R44DRAFT_874280 [Mycena epipterygia]
MTLWTAYIQMPSTNYTVLQDVGCTALEIRPAQGLEEDEDEHKLSVEEELENQPGILPEEYGVLEEEEDYPEIETIRPGKKGKEIVMILPQADWFLKAARWAQALDLMTRVLHELDDESESEVGLGSDSHNSDNESD